MHTKGKSCKIAAAVLSVAAACCVLCVFATEKIGTASATSYNDTESYVMVDEIYDTDTGLFKKDNFNELLRTISGDETESYENIVKAQSASDSTVLTMANEIATASDIREKSYNKSGSDDDADGQDVEMTFGGLTWEIVYLSEDRDGDAVATLWLSNNVQDAWTERTNDEGDYYGFYEGGLYSDWSADWNNTSKDEGYYPSALYGTSYIRAVTLNNGGYYTTGTNQTDDDLTEAEKTSSSAFALFTVDELGLTDFLDTPSQMEWQETEYTTGTTVTARSKKPGNDYTNYDNYPNNAYGTPAEPTTESGDANRNTYVNDYAAFSHYSDWKDDYLWLPGTVETGAEMRAMGIWDVSREQRMNYDGTNPNNSTTVGVGSVDCTAGIGTSKNTEGSPTRGYTRTWFRNADTLYGYACDMQSDGCYENNSSSRAVYCSQGVRPALHLNLSKIAWDIEWGIGYTDIKIDGIDGSFVYDGSEHTFDDDSFTVTAVDGETALTLDTDYKITYVDNTNAGTASVVFTGAGEYHGTVTKTFTIAKATPALTLDEQYSGYEGTSVSDVVTDSGGTFVFEDDTIARNRDTYSYTFVPKDSDNYETVTGTVTVNCIKVASIRAEYSPGLKAKDTFDSANLTVYAVYEDNAEKEITDYTYNMTYGDTLVYGNTLTVTYEIGEGNIFTDTLEVNALTPDFSLDGPYTGYEGGSVFELVAVTGSEGTIVFNSDTILPGENTYTYTYTPIDTDYETVTGTVTVTGIAVSKIRAEYSGELVAKETFDESLLTVYAVYEDETTKAVTDFETSIDDGGVLSYGTDLTVTYKSAGGTELLFTLGVEKATPVLDLDGPYMGYEGGSVSELVTVTGSERTIVFGSDTILPGENTYTYTYTPTDPDYETVTGTVTVTGIAVTEIRAEYSGELVAKEEFDANLLSVYAVYADGEEAEISDFTANHNTGAVFSYGTNLTVAFTSASGNVFLFTLEVEQATPTLELEDVYKGYETESVGGVVSVEGGMLTFDEESLLAGENEYTYTFVPDDPDYRTVAGTVIIDGVAIVGISAEYSEDLVHGNEFDDGKLTVVVVFEDGVEKEIFDYGVSVEHGDTLSSEDGIEISFVVGDRTFTFVLVVASADTDGEGGSGDGDGSGAEGRDEGGEAPGEGSGDGDEDVSEDVGEDESPSGCRKSDGVPTEIIVTLAIIIACAVAAVVIMCCSFGGGKKPKV